MRDRGLHTKRTGTAENGGSPLAQVINGLASPSLEPLPRTREFEFRCIVMQYERAVTRAYVIKIFNVHIRRPNRLGRRCCILRIPTYLATHLILKYFYLKLKNIPFYGTWHSQYTIDENRDICIIHLVPTDTYRLLTSTVERNFSQLRATKPTLV